MNWCTSMFETKNLKVIKATFDYISDYYKEFTDVICEYQYPDAFTSIEDILNESI